MMDRKIVSDLLFAGEFNYGRHPPVRKRPINFSANSVRHCSYGLIHSPITIQQQTLPFRETKASWLQFDSKLQHCTYPFTYNYSGFLYSLWQKFSQTALHSWSFYHFKQSHDCRQVPRSANWLDKVTPLHIHLFHAPSLRNLGANLNVLNDSQSYYKVIKKCTSLS